jgi:N-acetylmuramoyl-L-alanine amidase
LLGPLYRAKDRRHDHYHLEKTHRTDWLVVHCSAARATATVGAADIRRWHLGQGWADIGYHYVIGRDGTLETGRAEDTVGSM